MKANHRPIEPGQLQATQGARALGVDFEGYLHRHLTGDWGKIDPRLQASNERAVELGGGPIASAYETPAGWLLVITQPDRSATVFLVPSELPQ
jgi:hypothetical protein